MEIPIEQLHELQQDRQNAQLEADRYKAAYERVLSTLVYMAKDKYVRQAYFKHIDESVGVVVDHAIEQAEALVRGVKKP